MILKRNFSAALVGFIFAIGLGVSGMTQPLKVVAFLDVTGNWDPTLAFVMIGAIMVHFVTYRLILKRETPLFSNEFKIPKQTVINPKLLGGAFIFGMGWALGGFCPGPALTSVASFELRPFVFVIAMIIGMFSFNALMSLFKKQH